MLNSSYINTPIATTIRDRQGTAWNGEMRNRKWNDGNGRNARKNEKSETGWRKYGYAWPACVDVF